MIDLIRRLLGADRFEKIIPEEQRDRFDALRSAKRGERLAARLRDDPRARQAIGQLRATQAIGRGKH